MMTNRQYACSKPFAGLLLVLSFSASPAVAGGPQRDAAALTAFVDHEVESRLKSEGITPAPIADEAEFLRRVFLDLIGTIPTSEETVAFLDSTTADKRTRLVDDLLARPEYGRHLAITWGPRLFIDTSQRVPEPMTDWLQEQFHSNRPWNELVGDILTATGRHQEQPAATFFLNNNTVADAAEATARAFLGIQLQCAQCHDHPFAEWKQSDYWGLAAFYEKVNKYTRRRGASSVEEEDGSRPLWEPPEGHLNVPPKFLAGDTPVLGRAEPYRPVLAAWMTSPENPFFAQAKVNRTWAHLFGRGLVNPADDLLETNPPSHPRVLDELSRQFVLSGFDVKFLMRSLALSRTYQRSSAVTADERQQELFGRMPVRSLTPRQLADARRVLSGRDPGGAFLKFFETREELDPLGYHAGIPPTLMMMNSLAGTATGNLLQQTVDPHASPETNVGRLFVTVLSRRPTAEESQKYAAYVAAHRSQTEGCRDLVWALLNSAEFLLYR